MGDNDEYARGFYDAVTPVWEAFTFDEGRRAAIFCHIFGVRYQYTVRVSLMNKPEDADVWKTLQTFMIEQCARHIARSL